MCDSHAKQFFGVAAGQRGPGGVVKAFDRVDVADRIVFQHVKRIVRAHDDVLGAATFTARLGKGFVLFQAVSGMHPVVYERFIVNAARFLV